MAQLEGFKHITVTAAGDEDVVIHAGMAEEPAPVSASDSAVASGGVVGAQPPAPAAEGGTSQPEDALKVDDPRPASQPRPKPKSRPQDAYRETTLEDLQGQPMPLVQRIVIVAAIICIIGAVIYCVAFMR